MYVLQAQNNCHLMCCVLRSLYDLDPPPEALVGHIRWISKMTVMNAKRLSVIISDDLDRLIDELAADAGTSRTDVVRRALAVLKAFKQQKKQGRSHIGFVSDPTKLDAEIVNVL